MENLHPQWMEIMKSFDREFLGEVKDKMDKDLCDFRHNNGLPWENNEVYRKCILIEISVVKPSVFEFQTDEETHFLNAIPVGFYD